MTRPRWCVLLTERQIARLADERLAIQAVRAAFRAADRGATRMPAKVYLTLPGRGDFRAMPAAMERPPASGMKWVNVHPGNPRRGLPTVMALILLNDPATGEPLAVMEGGLITKWRTAASGAVAADVLARAESRTVGLIGCGAQAETQVRALAAVRPVTRVLAWGPQPGEAARLCATLRRVLPRVACSPCRTIAACVAAAEILVTITPSRRPLVQRDWVRPGTHINAIGADAPGKQELDWRILRDARVFVDERVQALHGGELNVPVARGQLDARVIRAELGAVLNGRCLGRRSARDITVFDSTGMAIHDVAMGAAILRRARALGRGRRIAWQQ